MFLPNIETLYHGNFGVAEKIYKRASYKLIRICNWLFLFYPKYAVA